MIELVTEELKERIERCFSDAETSIQIASPFLSKKTAELLSHVCRRNPNIECTLLTRLYMKDLLEGSNSLDALNLLIDAGVNVYAVQALHAKLYIFDDSEVVIGSANFTWSGMNKNYELSILTDESNIIERASLFFDEMISYCSTNDGHVTKELIRIIKSDYEDAYKERQKDFGFTSLQMYGALREGGKLALKKENWKIDEINTVDNDPVFNMMTDTLQKKTDFRHNIWVKFEGRADSRQPGYGLPTLSRVDIDGKMSFILNFRNRPKSIQSGDQIYIVSLTNDEDGKPTTRIVGRGKAKAYQNKNRVRSEWIKQYKWMSDYCFFCEIVDAELLNLKRMDCIPLDQVYDALGKNTYTSTIDKEEVKNMSLCQCRRSHLQMTLDAKDYIDKEIDRLGEIHGFVDLEQEDTWR